jgi:pyridoxamine 5'-phosphate oxidase
LERQVRIEGRVEKISAEESAKYFNSRPLGSRLGAIISPQSNVIENRQWLENKYDSAEKEYKETSPLKPDYWGGYIVKPYNIEFWQGRSNRLHDRILYSWEGDRQWAIKRLAP